MIFRHALLPGSYDPVTLGHLSLILRAGRFCERVSACVFVNPQKSTLFSIEERHAFLALACEDIPRTQAYFHLGTEPEFTRAHGCDIIIKGVRSEADLAYERAIVTDWARENRTDYRLMVGDTDENGALKLTADYPIKGTDSADFCMREDVPPMLLLSCEAHLQAVSSTEVRRCLSEGRSLSHLLAPSVERAVVAAFEKRK